MIVERRGLLEIRFTENPVESSAHVTGAHIVQSLESCEALAEPEDVDCAVHIDLLCDLFFDIQIVNGGEVSDPAHILQGFGLGDSQAGSGDVTHHQPDSFPYCRLFDGPGIELLCRQREEFFLNQASEAVGALIHGAEEQLGSQESGKAGQEHMGTLKGHGFRLHEGRWAIHSPLPKGCNSFIFNKFNTLNHMFKFT